MEDQNQMYNDVADQMAIHSEAQKNSMMSQQTNQMHYQMEEGEKNLADSQLDCERILFELYHSLKQDVLRPNPKKDGVLDWFELKGDDLKKRVLTDEGIDEIMQVMKCYINKETLLSNFDDKKINERMLDFCLAFNGKFMLKYEVMFSTPTLEECKIILINQINDKVKKIKTTADILDEPCDEVEVRRQIVLEMKPRMEIELTKIKDEKRKINLRAWEMIFIMLTHLVESTHNRAWKGEERGSLRRHFNISEVIGGGNQMMQQKKKWGIW